MDPPDEINIYPFLLELGCLVGKPLEDRKWGAEDIKMYTLTCLTEIVREDVKWIELSLDSASVDAGVSGVLTLRNLLPLYVIFIWCDGRD
jgi:hypothetical protein